MRSTLYIMNILPVRWVVCEKCDTVRFKLWGYIALQKKIRPAAFLINTQEINFISKSTDEYRSHISDGRSLPMRTFNALPTNNAQKH